MVTFEKLDKQLREYVWRHEVIPDKLYMTIDQMLEYQKLLLWSSDIKNLSYNGIKIALLTTYRKTDAFFVYKE